MPSKKYKWEVVAKDYNAPFIKNYIFTKSFLMHPGLFKISRAEFGVVSRKNQIEFITDFSTWQKAHDDLINMLKKIQITLKILLKILRSGVKK